VLGIYRILQQQSFECVNPSNQFTRITHSAERLPLERSADAKAELAILPVYFGIHIVVLTVSSSMNIRSTGHFVIIAIVIHKPPSPPRCHD